MYKFLPTESPHDWYFIDPDTGREYRAASKRALFSLILNYREQNRLPTIEQLNDVLENFLCSLPENAGKCHEYQLSRGFDSYVKGGIALVQNLFFGEKNIVADEEAERRAHICIKCPQNVFPDKDLFVKWSDNLAFHSTGGKKVSVHNGLGNCGCCTCPLKAKVFHKGPFKLTEKEEKCIKDTTVPCWQLENYESRTPGE